MPELNLSEPIRVAAVQVTAKLADILGNIEHAEKLAREAARAGAKIVALPEFFTTPIAYDERLFACSLPPVNPAVDMMTSLAREYRIWIGGSYLEKRDGEVYNTYVLAEPDGALHRHDKDIPTMVENSFYIGGSDSGLFETGLGSVGAAVCWETIRTQTVHRLRSKVALLMTGSHWWSEPGWPWVRKFQEKLHAENAELMRRTPGLFASLVGAPSLHAAHAGIVEGRYLLWPLAGLTLGTRTQLMGETQICEADGTILARRSYREGAGVVAATITLGSRPTREEPPNRFWIPELDWLYRSMWRHQNACGKAAYQRAKNADKLSSCSFEKP